METNDSAESVGRGLRASVVLLSLGICLLLFWGMKSIFQTTKSDQEESAPARKSSFSPIKRNPSAAPPESDSPVTTVSEPSNSAKAVPSLPQAAPATPAVIESQPAIPIATPRAEVSAANPSGAATSFGSLTGKVTLLGNPEPEKLLPLDPLCGKLHNGAKPTTQFYVISPDGGLADVFVYITGGLENRNFLPPQDPLILDQVGCLYVPYVAGAMTGQTIEVRNSDPLLHNVHPTPTVVGNQEHNKAHLPKAAPLLFKWNNPEVFLRFKCDVHPWMFAYIGLLPHPYFAVSDANGNYTIPNLPPGTYDIEFYHRKNGKVTAKVTIGAGSTTTLNQQIELVK